MIASCLLSDRHFLDALPMLFIILRLVLRSRRQRISNTFSCRWENIWLSLSINGPIQQQIWRWMAKDSFSNSIMLSRVLQALSSIPPTIFSTLVSSLWATLRGFKMAASSPGIMPTVATPRGKEGTNSCFLLRLWLKNFLTTSLGRSLNYFCSS